MAEGAATLRPGRLLLAAAALAGSCGHPSRPATVSGTTTAPASPPSTPAVTPPYTEAPAPAPATVAPTSPPASAAAGLPPGALNPDVTQATIGSTICVRGWTATVRPPQAYTDALKRRQMAERHLPGSPADYEEDHLVPLELGGATRDPANLWPEPRSGPPPLASDKDGAENRLRRSVCAGATTLDRARALIRDPSQWHV